MVWINPVSRNDQVQWKFWICFFLWKCKSSSNCTLYIQQLWLDEVFGVKLSPAVSQTSLYPEPQPAQDAPFYKLCGSALGPEQSEVWPSVLFAKGSRGVRWQMVGATRLFWELTHTGHLWPSTSCPPAAAISARIKTEAITAIPAPKGESVIALPKNIIANDFWLWYMFLSQHVFRLKYIWFISNLLFIACNENNPRFKNQANTLLETIWISYWHMHNRGASAKAKKENGEVKIRVNYFMYSRDIVKFKYSI